MFVFAYLVPAEARVEWLSWTLSYMQIDFEPACGCWELNPGVLRKRQVLSHLLASVYYLHLCVCVSTCMGLHADTHRGWRALDPLELELQVVVNHLIKVLGTKSCKHS